MESSFKFSIKKIVQRYAYYGIFFLISGIVHYYLCFRHETQKKVVIIPAAAIQAIKELPKEEAKPPEPEKKPEEKQNPTKPPEPEKKPEPKAEPPKPEVKEQEKKEDPIHYRENLEKKLREELQEKLEKMEKQKQEEVEKLQQESQQQKQKEMEEAKKELEKAHQEKVKELEEVRQKQEQMNQQLSRQLAQVTQKLLELELSKKEQDARMEEMKHENEKKLQETVQSKIDELEKQNHQKIEQMKQQHEQMLHREKLLSEERMHKKDEQLATAMKLLEKQQVRHKQIEQSMSLRQKELEEKLTREKNDIEARQTQLQEELAQQKQLVQKILQLKQQREKEARASEEKEIIDKQWSSLEQVRVSSLAQHQAYVAQFSRNSDDKGVTVPALNFFDQVFERYLPDIVSFHKLQMIAYPSSNRYFVTVDLSKEEREGRFQKHTDFEHYFRRFSNRIITATYGFPSIVRQIQANGSLYNSSDGPIRLAYIFPQSTADYMAWKSVTVCKKYGYDPKEVAVCNGYFAKTRNDFWSLIIKKLILKSGKEVPVEDFEKNW